MKMYAYGWKKDGNIYAVQVCDIKHGEKKELSKIFGDWKETSFGWNAKSNEMMVIYSKEFHDQKDWLCWAKKCPIKLTEIKFKNGKEERIQLSGKEKKKRVKNELCNKEKTIKEASKKRRTTGSC